MHALMAGKACLQTLRKREPQGFVQGVVHGDGRGTVVDPVLPPIRGQKIHVKIPALHLGTGMTRHFKLAQQNSILALPVPLTGKVTRF